MNLLLILFFMTFPTSDFAAGQAAAAQKSATAMQSASTPETVVKDFYRWYIDQLNTNRDPLTKGKTTLRKYLTPDFLRKAPKFIEQEGADPFICAQDWDKDWGKNVTVANLKIQSAVATMTVTLSGKEIGKHRLKVKLRQLDGAWKIDKIDPLDL